MNIFVSYQHSAFDTETEGIHRTHSFVLISPIEGHYLMTVRLRLSWKLLISSGRNSPKKENFSDDVDIKVWLIHKHEHHHKIEGKSDFFHRSLRIASYRCLMMMARWRLNDIFTCWERPRNNIVIWWAKASEKKGKKAKLRWIRILTEF